MAQLWRIMAMTKRNRIHFPLTLLLSMQAYQLDAEQPLGRQSAGAGLLEAYLRYGKNHDHHIVITDKNDAHWFQGQAQRWNEQARTIATTMDSWGASATTSGACLLPGPGLDEWAWKRMPWGDGAFSLIGLVHTLCSRQVQWGLGQFATSPIRPWDALICTSEASKTVIENFFDRQENWLRERLGAKHFERPHLPIIPLGIHTEAWAPPGGKEAAKHAARSKFNIPAEAQVVLVAGRLDILTKFHPGPLLETLAQLQQSELPDLHLLIYGEAPNAGMEVIWKEAIREVAPDLPTTWIAGRQQQLAAPVRWASDLFISLADNPQETFGITPLEAMAAELPCLVSDWDGYRDTVNDQVGIRIRTTMIEGLGEEEAAGMLNETLRYDLAVGRIAQGVAIDQKSFRNAVISLLKNPERLRTMGSEARKHVNRAYSWPIVIEQWRELLSELHSLRRKSETLFKTRSPEMPHWLRATSEAYSAFPSEVLEKNLNFKWNNPESKKRAQELADGGLNQWDTDLRQDINKIMRGEHVESPRATGWLLKNNLINI